MQEALIMLSTGFMAGLAGGGIRAAALYVIGQTIRAVDGSGRLPVVTEE